MGAAMAPAFVDTLITHFKDTGRDPSYYDAIISGDLGYIGKEISIDIAKSRGYNIASNYNDCGVLIFNKNGVLYYSIIEAIVISTFYIYVLNYLTSLFDYLY